jgi:pimeloyl-ACP methyl ester carboxylesterase
MAGGVAKSSGGGRISGAMLVVLWLSAAPAMSGERTEQIPTSPRKDSIMSSQSASTKKVHGYAPVNGLEMYYEIEGSGDPLVYIPPMFGFAGLKSFPALTRRHAVITVDLQGNGRTADIPDRPLSIRQYAKDVVALLSHLGIQKADFLGESYGASTAVMIAIDHPGLVRRVAAYGGTYGPPEVAHNMEMLRYDQPPTPDSRGFGYLKQKYEEVAPDPSYWPRIWAKAVALEWDGFSNEQLASIKVPVLIVVGDHDFVRVEHAADTFKRIPGAELAVIPDAGHFALYSEQERVIPLIEYFLEKPEHRPPVATAEMGYRPGETR